MYYNKGEQLLAINSQTNEKIKVVVPSNNMCKILLTRYLVMECNFFPDSGWVFIKN